MKEKKYDIKKRSLKGAFNGARFIATEIAVRAEDSAAVAVFDRVIAKKELESALAERKKQTPQASFTVAKCLKNDLRLADRVFPAESFGIQFTSGESDSVLGTVLSIMERLGIESSLVREVKDDQLICIYERKVKVMHNVQYYLKTLDRDRLEETFFETYPIHYEEWATDCKKLGLPIGGIREWEHERFRKYVDKLCAKTPTETDSRDGKKGVIYTYRCLESGRESDLETDMFFPEDGVDSYGMAYEFQPPEEILGYMVADNELTQLNIYKAIADVLYEASFFGYGDEVREDKAEKILRSVKEAKQEIEEYYADSNHNPEALPGVTLEELIRDLEARKDDPIWVHLKTEAAENPEQQALRSRIEEMKREYSLLSCRQERKKVIKAWEERSC